MKLNAKMLYEAVKEVADVSLLGEGKSERNLRFPCFYDGDADHLIAGGVYLAESSVLPRRTLKQQDILWVTWSGEPEMAVPGCPVLVFHTENRPEHILNLLQETFMRFCSWEESLDNILSADSNVAQMISVTEPLFRHPLCVVDNALNYLGYSESFMHIQDPDAPTPSPALFYDEAKDLIAKLHKPNANLGTLYLIHSDTPISETEQMLFQILAEKLTDALQNLAHLSGLYLNSFKQQMEQLFYTKQADEDRLYESLAQWGGQKGDTFICYKVKASHINQKINANYICNIFENVLQAAIAFWHDDVLVVMVDVKQYQGEEKRIHAKMEKLLTQIHMKAGVSLPFTELDKAWYHFRQACCAFEEGYPVDSASTLYFFQDYVPSYLLHHALGEFPKTFLLDKGMQRLLEHDRLYAVSYLDTLNAFFQCRMNMSQTAELLNIHRTSLNSRMQKIWECLDHEQTQEYLLYLQMVLAILKAPQPKQPPNN